MARGVYYGGGGGGGLGITNPFAQNIPDLAEIDKTISEIERNKLYGEDLRSQIAEREANIAWQRGSDDYGGPASGTQTQQGTLPQGAGTAPTSSYAGGIAGFEGGGASNPPDNPYWPQARGGPAGAHQFIASTWNDFARANPDLFKGMSPEQVLAARNDPELSTKAANWYASQNATALQRSGIAPTPANLGIAHTLGPGGAAKVLGAPDDTPLAQLIPETLAQNPQYRTMTVGQMRQKYARLGPVDGQQPAQPPGSVPATPAPYQVATTGAVPGPPTQAPATTPAPQQQLPEPIVQAAKWLRDMPEADAAAAYPRVLDELRRAGVAIPNAPPVYPGHKLIDQMLGNAPAQAQTQPPAAPAAPAAPQAPAPAQAATQPPAVPDVPPPAPPPPTNERGLTDQNRAQLATMRGSKGMTPALLAQAETQMRTHNEALKAQHRTDLEQHSNSQFSRQQAAATAANTAASQALAREREDREIKDSAYRQTHDANMAAAAKQKAATDLSATQFSQANTLRDEYNVKMTPFLQTQAAYNNVKSSAKGGTGASDMALIYAYIKMQDPNVVHGAEVDMAAKAGGYGPMVLQFYDRVKNGQILPEQVRKDFLKVARELYGNRLKEHDENFTRFETLAKKAGLDPEMVVTRYARPDEDPPEQEEPKHKKPLESYLR